MLSAQLSVCIRDLPVCCVIGAQEAREGGVENTPAFQHPLLGEPCLLGSEWLRGVPEFCTDPCPAASVELSTATSFVPLPAVVRVVSRPRALGTPDAVSPRL